MTRILAAAALLSLGLQAGASGSAATPPPAPGSLTATAGNGQVSLSWTPVTGTGTVTYNVRRATTSGGPYTTIQTGLTVTSAVVGGLTNGTTYYFVVRSVDSTGQSGNSNQASATPTGAGTPPAAPTGLTATGGNAQVALNWGAVSGATGYNVKSATSSGGPYTNVATGVTATSFTHSGLTNGTTYFYVVSAVNGTGEGANSAQASATPNAPPAAPTGLTATPGDGQVSLSWSASAGASSYIVARSTTSGGPYTNIATGLTTTAFLNTGLTNGTTYYYVVRAVASGVESANSSPASATPAGSTGAPAPPVLSATAGNSSASLSWTSPSGATSFNLKRGPSAAGPFTTIAGGLTPTSYLDTGLANGTTYYYVVTAVGTGGESANSNVAAATPGSIPAPPTNVQATPGNGQITVTWTNSAGATSYNVRRSTNSAGPYTTIATGVQSPFVNTGVSSTITYFYVVRAVNSSGQSGNSAPSSGASPLNSPPVANDQAVSTAEDTPRSITLTGSDPEGTPLTFTVMSGPSSGTISGGTGAARTYTPSANFTGTDSFTFTVTDAGALSDATPATVTITVTAVPDAPTANGQNVSTPEDTPTPITLTGSDPDVPTTLTFQVMTNPTNGALSGTAPNLTYTPFLNYFGPDSFTFRVNDGTFNSTNATVTINVAAVNDPPTAVNDNATVGEDSGANSINVLANDSIAPDTGETLQITIVTQGANGAVVITGGGTGLTYAPNANFSGADQFTYTISDGSLTAVATVNVTVMGTNDPPDAVDDPVTVAEDSGATQINVLANDTFAPDTGETLTVTGVTQPASGGSVTFNATSVTFTPTTNFFGTSIFTYTISDGNGGSDTATVTVTVTPVNDNPDAVNDPVTVGEDSGATQINVLSNDTFAPDIGETLTVTGVTQPASGGSVTFNATSVTFTPTTNFFGTSVFTYTISDGNGGSDTATVTVTVNPMNDNPDAVDDVATVAEDSGTTAINVLANDTALPDTGETLTVALVTQGTNGGTVNITGGGSGVSFTPALHANGPETFTYTISDGNGGTDTATVTVTVSAVNDSPTITNPGNQNGMEDVPSTVNLTGIGPGGGTDEALQIVTVTATSSNTAIVPHPTVTGAGSNRTLNYAPVAQQSGAVTITVTADDGQAQFSTTVIQFNLVIAAVNDPPDAIDDAATVNEDAPATAIDVRANDTALPDTGETLTITQVTQGTGGGLVVITGPGTGVNYTPALNFNGPETFTYTISDGNGGTDTATVTVTVNAVNDPPTITNPGNQSGVEDTAGSVPLTGIGPGGGTDEALQTVTVTATSSNTAIVPHPTVTGTGSNRTLNFSPVANQNGTVQITVTADDGQAQFNQTQIVFDLTIGPANDPPTIDNPGPQGGTEDTPGTVPLTGIGPGPGESQSVTISVTNVSDPSMFTATPTIGPVTAGNATLSYTPALNRNGPVQITVTVDDGQLINNTTSVTFTLTLAAVNDPPTATADSYNTNENQVLNVVAPGVLGNDSDVDVESITAVLVGGPLHAQSFTLNADGSFNYDPVTNYNGPDSFTYQARDPSSTFSAVTTVSITVIGTNSNPTANNDPTVGNYTVDEDTNLPADGSRNVLSNDTDPDAGDTLTAQLVSGPANAAFFTLNSDGTFSYTPSANFNGVTFFTYQARDQIGALSNIATVNITINAVNDPPQITNMIATPNGVAPLGFSAIDVTANDIDSTLNNASYSYIVSGGNISGTGPNVNWTAPNLGGVYSIQVTVTDGQFSPQQTVFVTVSPLAPTGLIATPGDTRVSLFWNGSVGAATYTVKRRQGSSGPFSTTFPGILSTAFTDTTVTNGILYNYVVSASNTAGESPDSSPPVAVTPNNAPPPPTNLIAMRQNNLVNLSWTASPQAVSYNAYVAQVSGGPYNPFVTGWTGTSVNTGATNGQTSYFVVTAVNAGGIESIHSNEAHATPVPGPQITSGQPWDGMSNVNLGTHVELTFSEPMNRPSVEGAASMNGILGMQFFWASDTQLTVVFDVILPPGIQSNDLLAEATEYTFTLSTAARNQSNQNLPSPYVTRFTTRTDVTPPLVLSTVTNGGQNPATTTLTGSVTSLTLTFNEPMNQANGTGQVRINSRNDEREASVGNEGPTMNVQWTSATTLLINLNPPLRANDVYRLELQNTQDLANNWLNNFWDYVLVTAKTPPDAVAPTVNGTTPFHTQPDVPRDSGIFIAFSEIMARDVASHITILENGSPATTPVRKEYSTYDRGVWIEPLKAWPAGATIRVNIGAGAQDNSFNNIAAGTFFTFDTVAASPSDSDPIALDVEYSGFKPGATDVDSWNFGAFMLFKNNVTGQRVYLDRTTLSVADVTLVEEGIGIPAKGYVIEQNDRDSIRIQNGNGANGLRSGAVYRLTLNASLHSSKGASPVNPSSFLFTVVTPWDGNARPVVTQTPEARYRNSPGGAAVEDLRTQVQNQGQGVNLDGVSVRAQDSIDPQPDVTQSSGGPTQWFNFEYFADPQAQLSTPGTRHVTFTYSDSVPGHTFTIRAPVHLPGAFGTLSSTQPAASSADTTPAYEWLSLPAGTDMLFMEVVEDRPNGESVYNTLVSATPTGTHVHPADQPLNPGQYKFRMGGLKALDGVIGSEIGMWGVERAFTITGAAATPSAPTAMPGSNFVDLTWDHVGGAVTYNVWRGTVSGGPYPDQVGSNVSGTFFSDTTAINGTTYYYVITAVNAGGQSGNSPEVIGTPVPPPGVPSGVGALAGNTQVTVSWTAVAGATEYEVDRGLSSGGPFSFAGTTLTTNLVDTGLTNGTAYFYVVRAANNSGDSAFSSPAVSATPAGPPLPPGGLTATSGNGFVALGWNPTADTTSYNVLRATAAGGPYGSVGAPTGPSFLDSTVVNDTPYFYRVRSVNVSGESGDSATVSATPTLPPPAIPTGLVATAGNGQVSLGWNTVAGATGYWVKRSGTSNTGPFARIVLVVSPAFIDTSLPNGVTFHYVVSAVNGGGETGNSAPATATPSGPLNTPWNLQANGGSGNVNLGWNSSSGAANYDVFRSTTSGGPFGGAIGNTTFTGFNDTTALNGTTYFYVVEAVNGANRSPATNQATATPLAIPPAPSATPGNMQVSLTWAASAGATAYNVKRAAASGGPYFTIASPSTNSYVDTGLTNGTTYFYKIQATAPNSASGDSNFTAATPVAPPTPFVVNTNPGPPNTTEISPATHVVITFNEAMDQTPTQNAISLSPAPLGYQFFWSGGGTIVTVVFDTTLPLGIEADDILAEGVPHILTVGAAATSLGTGLQMGTDHVLNFTTKVDVTPPDIVSIMSIAAIPQNVATTTLDGSVTGFTITFNDEMDQTSGQVFFSSRTWEANDMIDNPGPQNPGNNMLLTWTSSTTLQVALSGPNVPLAPRSLYRLSINSVRDTSNNYRNWFDTPPIITSGNPVTDTTRPTVTGAAPFHNQPDVPRETAVMISFSEPMHPDLASRVTVFENGSPATTPLDIFYDPYMSAVVVEPRQSWPAGATVKVVISKDARDSATNTISATTDYETQFIATTANDPTAMILDEDHSGFKPGMTDAGSWNGNFMMFKRGASGPRVYPNRATLAAHDVLIADDTTLLPVKGFQLLADDQDSLRIESRSNITPNLVAGATYRLTLKPSLKNFLGVGVVETNYTFTVASTSQTRPYVFSPPEAFYVTDTTGRFLELSTNLGNAGSPNDALRIAAADSPDTFTFSQSSFPGTPGSFNLNYNSSGPEATLPTTGVLHVMTFTYEDRDSLNAVIHTFDIKSRGWIFSSGSLPTVTVTPGGSFPTYNWGNVPTTGAEVPDLVFIQVVRDSDDALMFEGVVNRTLASPGSGSITQPADAPLPNGTYRVQVTMMKTPNGDLHSNESDGKSDPAFTFTIP